MSEEPTGGQPWNSPWADDARRIFEVLQGHSGEGTDEAGHASSDECRYCPLCQGMAMVRRGGPDVLDRIAELAAGLAATLRATAPDPPAGDGGDSPTGESSPPRPPSTVRIDVTD